MTEGSLSIVGFILDHANAEVERQRALNDQLLAALHAIVNADTLEAAQAVACSAIAIAIVQEEEK